MDITITDRSRLLDETLRELAERRLLFALCRFESRIEQVDLVLHDENGPRGGVDKRCRLSVALRHASDVVISDRDSDFQSCLSRLSERTSRAVARAIERSHRFVRSQRGSTALDT